ncbi:hypothetical protein [Metabacillus halosaccharovorans]|uniref:hypothetical protein n=1 Tax=Metabacillus halosaccharovorans TaxID=930124 RepID=UPI000994D66D|nr:hypothetical protein [Metabacillus halosaccharovorans]
MKKFFSKPSKVALFSLIATIVVTILLLCVLSIAGVESNVVHLLGKVTIGISLPFLILNPLTGLIYSFFINGKIKIVYILLHLACVCTISVFAFISFMFRYFVPFAP